MAIDRKTLRGRLELVLSLLWEVPVEIGLRFCDIDEMVECNGRFRDKPKPTDVLSFPPAFGQPRERWDEMELQQAGDILVCIPVCALQAKTFGSTFSAELERVIVHGIVHLRGLDHERSRSADRVQRTLEEVIRRELKHCEGPPSWARLSLG